jgi:hypothetical protein
MGLLPAQRRHTQLTTKVQTDTIKCDGMAGSLFIWAGDWSKQHKRCKQPSLKQLPYGVKQESIIVLIIN